MAVCRLSSVASMVRSLVSSCQPRRYFRASSDTMAQKTRRRRPLGSVREVGRCSWGLVGSGEWNGQSSPALRAAARLSIMALMSHHEVVTAVYLVPSPVFYSSICAWRRCTWPKCGRCRCSRRRLETGRDAATPTSDPSRPPQDIGHCVSSDCYDD